MNLQNKVDERIWAAIQSSYQARNFTGAVLDAIYFLTNLIRERTGLQSDGVALAGQALGGKTPKLKVNRLQTVSEQDTQEGVCKLVMGVYQAIRNPRSHEKFTDNEADADAIILLVDYLTRIVDRSRAPFEKGLFLARVAEKTFVHNSRYAELLVDEIPPRLRTDIFFAVFNDREEIPGENLKWFFDALLPKLSDEELSLIAETISDELKHSNSDQGLRAILQSLPPDMWLRFDEASRMRTENRIIDSIRAGKQLPGDEKTKGGWLATWAFRHIPHFVLKDELIWVLKEKLDSDDPLEWRYVLKFFFGILRSVGSGPDFYLKQIINRRLADGNVEFRDALKPFMRQDNVDDPWYNSFREAFESFKEPESTLLNEEDDLPF